MIASIGLTNMLALLYGLYLVAAAIGLLRQPQLVDAITKSMLADPFLVFLVGIFTLALGGTVVAIHNSWAGPVSVIVTLFGWAALVEGLLMLAIPGPFLKIFADLKFTPSAIRAISGVCILVGAILIVVALA